MGLLKKVGALEPVSLSGLGVDRDVDLGVGLGEI